MTAHWDPALSSVYLWVGDVHSDLSAHSPDSDYCGTRLGQVFPGICPPAHVSWPCVNHARPDSRHTTERLLPSVTRIMFTHSITACLAMIVGSINKPHQFSVVYRLPDTAIVSHLGTLRPNCRHTILQLHSVTCTRKCTLLTVNWNP